MATETLWTLLGQFRIIIPIIQRDYAQGRADERTGQIREAFVGALHGALRKPGQGIELDFLYGTTRTEKFPNPFSGTADRTLTLLDGQQRVTTLFLLHWYLARRADALDGEVRERLLRFTYETRVSSRQFCGKLIDSTPTFSGDTISGAMTDASWFPRTWRGDPTIGSMLTMLDTIHNALRGEAHEDLWAILVTTQAARFEFLEMDRFGLSDELYIKMNARGSALTEFENFKAWLEKRSDERRAKTGKCVLGDEERLRLDTRWTDLFWSRREPDGPEKSGEVELGPACLRFFTGMALTAALAAENPPEELSPEHVTALNANVFLPTSFYERQDLFDEATLLECVRVLDALSDGGADQIDGALEETKFFGKKASLFSLFVSKEITYEYRLMFYALCRFLLDRPADMSWEDPQTHLALRRWMRVVRNVALNVTVNVASFGQGVRAIRDLAQADGLRDVYGYLRDRNEPYSFATTQMDEEQRKAKLISPQAGVLDSEWEQILHKAEDHAYFQGRIGFLLDFSCDDGGTPAPGKFADYAAKAAAIFQEGPDSPSLRAPDFWLHRALLTRCDPGGKALIWASRSAENFSLGADHKDWTANLLHNDDSNAYSPWVRPLLGNLRALLDQIEAGKETEGLARIVNETQWVSPDDWRACFVRAPEVIAYCEYRRFKFASLEKIFPFSVTNMRGCHSELRSHVFYYRQLVGNLDNLQALNPLGCAQYWYPSGREDTNWPCAYLGGKIYRTEIRYGRSGHSQLPFEIKFCAIKKGAGPAAWEQEQLPSLGFEWNENLSGHLLHLGGNEEDLLKALCALAIRVAEHCPANIEGIG